MSQNVIRAGKAESPQERALRELCALVDWDRKVAPAVWEREERERRRAGEMRAEAAERRLDEAIARQTQLNAEWEREHGRERAAAAQGGAAAAGAQGGEGQAPPPSTARAEARAAKKVGAPPKRPVGRPKGSKDKKPRKRPFRFATPRPSPLSDLPVTAERRHLRDLAALGFHEDQMADRMGIDRAGFRKLLRDNPRLKAALDHGRAEAVEFAAATLQAKAREGNLSAIKFFLATRGGFVPGGSGAAGARRTFDVSADPSDSAIMAALADVEAALAELRALVAQRFGGSDPAPA